MDATVETERLVMRQWLPHHWPAFHALHVEPDVMADYGGPISESECRAKFERYCDGWQEFKISRFAIENHEGLFLGYCGIMFRPDDGHPLGSHHEVGWRFFRDSWGMGYAVESARASIAYAIKALNLQTIYSYTSPDNLRSQSVMARLGLLRREELDFSIATRGNPQWKGLVWMVEPQHFAVRN